MSTAMIDGALSDAVQSAMGRRRRLAGDCYMNAFRAIPEAARLGGGAPSYVEGWVRHGDNPADAGVAHGWLETPDNRVIDVTPTRPGVPAPLARAVLVYEAVQRFSISQVMEHLNKRGARWPILELDREEVGE